MRAANSSEKIMLEGLRLALAGLSLAGRRAAVDYGCGDARELMAKEAIKDADALIEASDLVALIREADGQL